MSTPAPARAARRPRWRYRHREVIFGDREQLWPDLFTALQGSWGDWLSPIPTAWPEFGALEEHAYGFRWWVGYKWTTNKGEELGRYSVATFDNPKEAFAFAEMKQAFSDKHRNGDERWYVLFTWERTREAAAAAKKGTLVELERLPAFWWRDQKRAAERAEMKRRRLSA